MAGIPHANGDYTAGTSRTMVTRRTRMPTVREALPFTPFASIIPFDAEILPAPTFAETSSINAAKAEENAATNARALLDRLSDGAERAENASDKYQKTLRDVKQLLQTSALSHFNFRKPVDRSPQNGSSPKKVKRPQLSKFAEALLQSPPSEPHRGNKPVVSRSQKHDARSPQQHQPRPTNTTGTTMEPLPNITVSKKLSPAQQAHYQKPHDRHVEDEIVVQSQHGRPVTVDEKAKGDSAVRELSALLVEIFESEDQARSDYIPDPFETSHFFKIETEEGITIVLSPASQAKLDSALRKTANSTRLNEIPLDSLKRLQKICEPSVNRTAFLSLRLDDHESDDSIEEWQQHLMTADASLVSLRIVLRIMTGCTPVRELRPESLVRSMLDVLKNVAESGLVPIVEARPRSSNKDKSSSASSSSIFPVAVTSRKLLAVMMQDFGKALRLLSDFLSEVEVDESAVSGIMYMCRALLFAENASTDKESVLGVQNFETLRRLAMNIVARLFQRHVNQRHFIINELLLSLEKLPPSKQSARQFRLPNSKPIQLVSALFMQLIQISAVKLDAAASAVFENDNDVEEIHTTEDDDLQDQASNQASSLNRLRSMIQPLIAATQTYAQYIVSSLVQRALNISKSSDEPFRKLLDIFVEDFLTVLGLPDWPSSELLLRVLFLQLASILTDNKSTVPSRNFALEILGRLGAGILNLRAQALKNAQISADGDLSDLGDLAQMLEAIIKGDTCNDLILGDSIYNKLLHALHEQTDTSQLATATGYHQLQWAQMVCTLRIKPDGDDQIRLLSRVADTSDTLRQIFTDSLWFERHAAETKSTAFITLASNLLVLSADFCKSLRSIVSGLHTSMHSDHATERGQALRSISVLIEADPSIIDQQSNVLKSIINCIQDSSPLVRDSAMNLLFKCMELRPALGAKMYESISLRCIDTSANVRKRAMKVLKEIFLRNDSITIRANIVRTIVGRVKDTEESVAAVAIQTLSDILYRPVSEDASGEQDNFQNSITLQSLAEIMVETVEVVDVEDELLASLISLVRQLTNDSKGGAQNMKVSRRLVEILFDGVIGDAAFAAQPSQALLLRTIALFVEAQPKLLKPSQLEMLAPYMQNLTNADLPMFRMALAVLRHGISQTKGLKQQFLLGLQSALMKGLGTLPETEVSDVAICLAAIDTELHNTEKLVNIQLSALKTLRASIGLVPEASARKVQRLVHMAGEFGRACDFEPYLEKYRSILNVPKGTSVASICVELFCQFTGDNQLNGVRKSALSAICAVAQRSPKQFLSRPVLRLFDHVIESGDDDLILVCIQGMLLFFSSQETTNTAEDGTASTGRERLASTYVATDQDGAAAGLSQHFLSAVIRLAIGSADELALTATRLMTSIVQQGLPHPKECGPTLIALETSPNELIAQLAAAEHRTLHDKHETIIEKEYMRSMDQALSYQQNTVRDGRGFTGQPAVSKLRHFWSVLKGGKAKVRQKFLQNLCQKMTFDPAELDKSHLAFVRFATENLAFFDYDRVDDLKLLVDQLGQVFAAVGASLAQTIDTQINRINMDSIGLPADLGAQGPDLAATAQRSSIRLEDLAISSQILLLVAETRAQLLRLWGGAKLLKRDKGGAAKDTSKAPTRSSNAAALAETFVARTAELSRPLPDEASQVDMCLRFTEVINIDTEAKVSSDDDALGSDDDGDDIPVRKKTSLSASGTPSGRKRKSVDRMQSTPKKKARHSPRRSLSAVSKQTDENESDGEWP